MKVIDPGHVYELAVLDKDVVVEHVHVGKDPVRLVFVKREGNMYPGNVGAHPGVTTQEVLRALIDRTLYVDRQIPHRANEIVVGHLRSAIIALEERAAERRGEKLSEMGLRWKLRPEMAVACETCGHVRCTKH